MRYWLSSLTIPAFIVVGAIMGCTTEAKPEEKNAAVAPIAAQSPVTKQVAPEDFTPPRAGEPAAKVDVPVKAIEPSKFVGPVIEPKVIETAEPVFLQPRGPKKGKGPKTPPKDKGEPTKEAPVPEPTEYMGKDFKHWLTQIEKTKDPTHREEAMKAILMFSPKKAAEAVPAILKQLERHRKPPGVDLTVRVNGIMTLNTIFSLSKEAHTPENLKRAVALYRQFLKDDQVIVRVRTLQGLPYLLPKSAEAIDDVIRYGAQYPGTWEVRKQAMQTLQFLAPAASGKGPPNKNAMIALRDRAGIKEEGDSSYMVRIAAVQAFANLAQDRVPLELYKSLRDPSEQVRLAGLRAIAGVASALDNLDSQELLKKIPKADIVKIKAAAVKRKAEIAERLEEHLRVEKKDKILRIWTHAAIITVTKDFNKKHIGPVVAYLNDSDPAVRMQALTVLGMCGDKGKPFAYDAVLAVIHDKNVALAGAAMGTLVNMGAYEAIDELKKLAKDEKAHAARRDTALDAIEHLEKYRKSLTEKHEKDKKTK